MIGSEWQTKLLTNRRQHQNHFHHCERRADTDARAGPEGEVRIFGKSRFELGRPTFRLEFKWLIEEARVAMCRPLKHEDLSSGRHVIAANLTIINRLATQAVRRRIQPH